VIPVSVLLRLQNADGGWPYRRGGSWTEPTIYSVLALAGGRDSAAAARGLDWIRAAQSADGGWPARPGVGESCWVTSLAALLPPANLGVDRHHRAIAWLSATTGAETTVLYRVRQWLMGNPVPSDTAASGWPWVTGSAAWVSPTSLAILALDREFHLLGGPGLAARVDGPDVPHQPHVQGRGMEPWVHQGLGLRIRPLPGNDRNGAGGLAWYPRAGNG